MLRSGRRSLARERNARERERERENTHERERDTDREKTSSGKRVHSRIEHRRTRGGARGESFVSEANAYHYGSERKGDDPSPS